MVNPKAHLSSAEVFLIGAISKTISTIVTYPYILAKVRLQSESQKNKETLPYRGTMDVLAKAIKADGILGIFQVWGLFLFCTAISHAEFTLFFFQGMTPQILKGVLSQAIQFMLKEEIMAMAIKILLVYQAARNKKNAQQ